MISSENQQTILDVTKNMVRQNGYNGFSFRNIAQTVGIKSSSVHYYYRTKEDLGAAVAKQYTDDFKHFLQSNFEQGNTPALEVFIKGFENALIDDNKLCLCGILAAECSSLPPAVLRETQAFFEMCISWLSEAFVAQGLSKQTSISLASTSLSLMEGALITAKVTNNNEVFEHASSNLKSLVKRTLLP